MLDVRLMEKSDYADFSALLGRATSAVFTQSLEYLNYLRDVLSNSQPMHLVAVDKYGDICGALPLMIQDGAIGRVINSLPYYGSHGSLILDATKPDDVRAELLHALDSLVRETNTLSCTVIDSPLDVVPTSSWISSDFEDERVCQMTFLPTSDSYEDAREAILSAVHSKTRNQIRKGLSQSYRICHTEETWALEGLHRIHLDNLEVIGGLAKSKLSLEAIPVHFQYDRHYRVYCALLDDQIVAALLVFYFKDHVEYFMPAVDHQHRSKQALSAIIFSAMIDGVVDKRARIWNWGGTWTSQTSLHHFKARWGAKDMPYRYATRLGPQAPRDLGSMNRRYLAETYPNFYVVPYSSTIEDKVHTEV